MLSTVVDLANGSLGLVSRAIPYSHSDISRKLDRVLSLLDSTPAMQQEVKSITASFRLITEQVKSQASLLEDLKANQVSLAPKTASCG